MVEEAPEALAASLSAFLAPGAWTATAAAVRPD